MASYISPYRGQSSYLPAGYLQAATESGRNIARGIEQAGAAIGEGLGKAIASYRQGEKDKEVRKAAYESLVDRVIKSDYGVDFQADSGDERAVKLADRSAKFNEMSAAQQKQLIADLTLYDADRKQAKEDAIKAGFDQAKMMQMQQVYEMNEAAKRQREQLAADQAAQAKALFGYTPETTKTVTETIPNPAYGEAVQLNEDTARMVQGFRDAMEQGRAVRQAGQPQQAPTAPPAAMMVDDTAAPATANVPAGAVDNALVKETLAKVIDDISAPVGSSSFTRVKPQYQEMLGGGLEYRSREADDIPEFLLDRVPTGRTQRGREITTTVPNMKRIGAFLQMLNRDGVNTLATRQLNELVNGQQSQRSAMPASAAAAFVQPREVMPDPVTPAQQQDQPATTAPVSTAPASAIDYSVKLPAETIERDVQVPLTAGDMDTNIREYIQRVMPDASSNAKRQTYEALRGKYIPEGIQQIRDEQGNVFQKLPSGFEPVNPPDSNRKQMTDTAVGKLVEIESAYDDLNQLKENFEDLGLTGPIIGILRSRNPYDTKAKEMQSLINQAVPNLARGIFGEVGVLTDTDIERYTKMLPSASTSGDLAKLLFDSLKRKLDSYKRRYIDTYEKAGFNVEQFKRPVANGVGPKPTADYSLSLNGKIEKVEQPE